jgi:hypothetical protein
VEVDPLKLRRESGIEDKLKGGAVAESPGVTVVTVTDELVVTGLEGEVVELFSVGRIRGNRRGNGVDRMRSRTRAGLRGEGGVRGRSGPCNIGIISVELNPKESEAHANRESRCSSARAINRGAKASVSDKSKLDGAGSDTISIPEGLRETEFAGKCVVQGALEGNVHSVALRSGSGLGVVLAGVTGLSVRLIGEDTGADEVGLSSGVNDDLSTAAHEAGAGEPFDKGGRGIHRVVGKACDADDIILGIAGPNGEGRELDFSIISGNGIPGKAHEGIAEQV